jgi:hypothetical protein
VLALKGLEVENSRKILLSLLSCITYLTSYAVSEVGSSSACICSRQHIRDSIRQLQYHLSLPYTFFSHIDCTYLGRYISSRGMYLSCSYLLPILRDMERCRGMVGSSSSDVPTQVFKGGVLS